MDTNTNHELNAVKDWTVEVKMMDYDFLCRQQNLEMQSLLADGSGTDSQVNVSGISAQNKPRLFFYGLTKGEWFRSGNCLHSEAPGGGTLLTDCRSPQDSRPAARYPRRVRHYADRDSS